VSSASDTAALITGAINRVLDEVPALKPLKLVFQLDLRGGRVEMPGPIVTKDVADDAKVRIEVPRAFFNEMAKDGRLADWREAFTYGQAKAQGPTQILQLIVRVVAKQEERNAHRRAKPHS
jgi:hypothetical protein